MAVKRDQDYFVVAVTLAAGTPLEVTLPRPTTLPAFSDTVDHVAAPAARREDEAGTVLVDVTGLPADSNLLKIEKVRSAASPFTAGVNDPGSTGGITNIDQEEPLFPTGASAVTVNTAFEDATGVRVGATNQVLSAVALLENLSVRSYETIRLTLVSAGGGSGFLRVTYDLGRNIADIGLQAGGD